jgi:hypothetical protein
MMMQALPKTRKVPNVISASIMGVIFAMTYNRDALALGVSAGN